MADLASHACRNRFISNENRITCAGFFGFSHPLDRRHHRNGISRLHRSQGAAFRRVGDLTCNQQHIFIGGSGA
ncbi:hypothetical protein [Cypionkella sp.]|uniref:hypothetical protein n=1 Tax=Cypionkella sp. TaxID=2811411 RepID=UPI002729D751|nr:hypothetical protein [Cypionkella sp.]